jgi:sortase (surface protein transpeptidase)
MLTVSNSKRLASRFLLAVGASSCMAYCLVGGPRAMAASVTPQERHGHHAGHALQREQSRQEQYERHEHRKHYESRSLDWRLFIPDIGVSAHVIKLGGPRVGEISVPSFAEVWDVGWYHYGAVPGDRGNALLLGHVDTYMGPAVFYDLYRLRPGEQVEVDLGHGDIKRFEVHWVKEVPKTEFPANRVFGSSRGRHLWLVTCGGQFDYTTRSYLSNIVVYTTLIEHHHHHR